MRVLLVAVAIDVGAEVVAIVGPGQRLGGRRRRCWWWLSPPPRRLPPRTSGGSPQRIDHAVLVLPSPRRHLSWVTPRRRAPSSAPRRPATRSSPRCPSRRRSRRTGPVSPRRLARWQPCVTESFTRSACAGHHRVDALVENCWAANRGVARDSDERSATRELAVTAASRRRLSAPGPCARWGPRRPGRPSPFPRA